MICLKGTIEQYLLKVGQFQSYHVVNESEYCGQPSQMLFGNRLKPGLAKHLVSLVHLGSCESSVQGNGWWRFFLNYQTVGCLANLCCKTK